MSPDVDGSSTAANSATADVVVVGGGLVGVCAALWLQQSGRAVTLVERSDPGAGASGHNGGVFNVGECVPTGTPGVLRSVPRMLIDPMSPLVIRYPYLPRLAPWLVRFILASRRSRVEEISIALKALTDRAMEGYAPLLRGMPAGALVRDGGLLQAYRSVEAFDADRFSHALRTRRGVRAEILDGPGIEKLDQSLAGRFQRAVYMPEPSFTPDPREFTRALAEQFTDAGGILRRAAVDGFEERDGRVQAVITTVGRIPAESVVIAAGAWSRRLVRRLGFDVPLDTERGYGVHLPNPGVSMRLPVIAADLHIGFRPTPTGLQVLGIDELASVSAPPRFAIIDRVLRSARVVFPDLGTDGATRWMHCRPSMPDSLPIIGRHPRYVNAYMAFGHGHKGLGLAGITGRLICELIDGESPSVDLRPYRPTRFRRLHRPASRMSSASGGGR
jgi:D-amino-acid dehydrogenase